MLDPLRVVRLHDAWNALQFKASKLTTNFNEWNNELHFSHSIWIWNGSIMKEHALHRLLSPSNRFFQMVKLNLVTFESTQVFHFTRLECKLTIMHYRWINIYGLKRMESFLSGFSWNVIIRIPNFFDTFHFMLQPEVCNKQTARKEKSFIFQCTMQYSMCNVQYMCYQSKIILIIAIW